MRRARFSPILAFLLTACSLLGPHPVLDCGASQDDADCIAVLTAAADRFPTAARLQMSDRPRPLLLGGEVWYVDATRRLKPDDQLRSDHHWPNRLRRVYATWRWPPPPPLAQYRN